MKHLADIVLLLILAGRGASTEPLSGTSTDESTAAAPPASPTIGKYQQTWTKPYGKTTCGDFENRMSPHQRFVLAADMLSSARDKGDGGEGGPPNKLINQFKADVDDGCSAVAGTYGVSDVAVGTYLTERSKYRP